MKLTGIILALLMPATLTAASYTPAIGSQPTAAYAQAETRELKFSDGKFRILVFSDTHNTDEPIQDTLALMNSALDNYAPDLLVFLGDNTAGWWRRVDTEKTRKAVDTLLAPVVARNVPFAFVFGNHVEDGDVAKDAIFDFYKAYPNCLAVENTINGRIGNYNLPIKSSDGTRNALNLYFLDSGAMSDDNGYDYVLDEQIAWYEQTSDELKAANGGEVLPSLLFQHIAVPEVYNLLDRAKMTDKGAVKGNSIYKGKYFKASDKIDYGSVREGPCPPDINNGQFESWKQKGDIVGAFFGHDHINNYSGVLDGIRLTSCVSTGFYSYGYMHGVTIVDLDENDPSGHMPQTKLFEEVVGRKPSHALIARWGLEDYRRKILPSIIVCPIVGVGICAAAALLARRYKKKKAAGKVDEA